MKNSSRLFWRTPAWRAVLEGWLIGTGLLLLILPGMDNLTVAGVAIALTLAAAGGWAALRAHLFNAKRLRLLLLEILFSSLTAAGYVLICVAVYRAGAVGGFFDKEIAANPIAYAYLVLGPPGIFSVRAASYLWQFWDRLRRTHYLWGLTHDLLSVLAGIGALLALLLLIITSHIADVSFTGLPVHSVLARSVIWTVSFLLITIIGVICGLAVFLLPISLASYSVARRFTDRLTSLMRTAGALRCGDLSARVEVRGEDELAVLQENFNRMAESLESSTHALLEERDKVTQLLRAQRELTASVSHELRTPVATLSGYVEALRRDVSGAENPSWNHDLEIIASETARLQTILNDLLTLSQSEVNHLSIHLRPVELEGVLAHVVDTLAPLAWKSKRIQVLAEPAAGLPPVQADALRLEQILINLVQNAVRHTPPGGVVTANALAEEGWLVLEVADTGEGISAADLEHVWEKFYQAGDSSSAAGGSGLGLALVRELTEAMGGRVSLESTPGEGSVFRVYLKPAPQN